jgi:AraC-like DNA-binding protein
MTSQSDNQAGRGSASGSTAIPNAGQHNLAGREQRFDAVNARLLVGFAPLCRTCGGDPELLLGSVGLAGQGSDDTPLGATYSQFVDLLAQAAEDLGVADFGMRLALGQSGTDLYGPLGTIMRHSQTLGEALDYVTQHTEVHSTAARVARYVIARTNGVVFSHEIIVGAFGRQEQAMEYILLAGHLGARALTNGRARARQVLLRHRAVSPMAVYRRNFGCEVLFDQLIDGIVFSHDDLASPVVSHDARLHASLISAVQNDGPRHELPIRAATRNVVLRLMHVGLASNEHVAAELGLHSRTLHRHLIRAGTTFQRIKDEVRCELVRYYLAHTDVSLMWITGKLGFAEQAVFTRFCRRHFGMSPSALREKVLSQG